MTSRIHIHSLLFDSARRDRIVRAVGLALGVEAAWVESRAPTDWAFDDARQQFHSTSILNNLIRLYSNHSLPRNKVVALVDVDLFIPVLTFVFGEAQLRGQFAVVSTARLNHEAYGLPTDDRQFESRVVKEIVHELGHTLGLYHCRNFECVMRSSTYVEEIDVKKEALCEACKRVLAEELEIAMVNR